MKIKNYWCSLIFIHDVLVCMERQHLYDHMKIVKTYGVLHQRHNSLDFFKDSLKVDSAIINIPEQSVLQNIPLSMEQVPLLKNQLPVSRCKRLALCTCGVGFLLFAGLAICGELFLLNMHDWELGRWFIFWCILTLIMSPVLCGILLVFCCQVGGIWLGFRCLRNGGK